MFVVAESTLASKVRVVQVLLLHVFLPYLRKPREGVIRPVRCGNYRFADPSLQFL